MAEFLTTYGTSSKIEEIMINAKHEIYLVSPFLQLSKTFYERLKDASGNNVKISIVYGKDELKPSERNSLAGISNLELFFSKNLHAKCYFNEDKMVITSMNMYEFSEKNNREMGVFIDLKNDKEVFENAKRETISIIKSAEIIKLSKSERSTDKKDEYIKNIAEPKKVFNQSNFGYCIRCGISIPFESNKPYCNQCYSSWAFWGNYEFKEKFCLSCGNDSPVSMAVPLCEICSG